MCSISGCTVSGLEGVVAVVIRVRREAGTGFRGTDG